MFCMVGAAQHWKRGTTPETCFVQVIVRFRREEHFPRPFEDLSWELSIPEQR